MSKIILLKSRAVDTENNCIRQSFETFPLYNHTIHFARFRQFTEQSPAALEAPDQRTIQQQKKVYKIAVTYYNLLVESIVVTQNCQVSVLNDISNFDLGSWRARSGD